MKKQEKENNILLGLIELYIKNGKPIGSNTLKDSGFEHFSSATIRNYFFKLEEQGYLTQQHASGGRIPTDLAYKFYIKHPSSKEYFNKAKKKALEKDLSFEGKEIISYFNKVIEVLSELTGCAVILSSPRFDQDFITDIRLLSLDSHRILCIVLTSFGMVHTEVFYTSGKQSNFSLKRIESYFYFLRTGLDKPSLDEQELLLAEHLYNEIMLRHIVGHATFIHDDIYKTGFTQLLNYPELKEPNALANALSLFENPHLLHSLCQQTCHENHLNIWVGEDLNAYLPGISHCSMIMVPYSIREKSVGAIGVLGPTRIPYKQLFEILKTASKALSDTLTSLLFKYQMTYRLPQPKGIDFQETSVDLEKTRHLLIADHSKYQDIKDTYER
jgi:heat-inducible transcriptional repressor